MSSAYLLWVVLSLFSLIVSVALFMNAATREERDSLTRQIKSFEAAEVLTREAQGHYEQAKKSYERSEAIVRRLP